MSKKKKQKYYAIKEGKGVKNKIVRSWDECKEFVHEYQGEVHRVYKYLRKRLILYGNT